MSEIHVCIACNDNYAPHGAALIASIMENKVENDQLVFHILSDKLSQKTKSKMEKMNDQWNFEIEFIDFSDEIYRGFPELGGTHTPYFRLAIHRLLAPEIKRVLYLDCDMIVTTSLSWLYHVDIDGKYGAVVAERKDSKFTTHSFPYFNSGMILFNLDKYRTDDIEKKIMKMAKDRPGQFDLYDQDLLNEVFQGNVVYLPLEWNVMLFPEQIKGIEQSYCSEVVFTNEEIEMAKKNPRITHFVTSKKPWGNGCTHPHQSLYWTYLKATPFYKKVLRRCRITRLLSGISFLKKLPRLIIQVRFGKKKSYIKMFGLTLYCKKESFE